jgi:hypothetical protein
MSIFDPPYLKSRLTVSDFERVDVPGFELPIDQDGRVEIPAGLREQLLIEGASPLMAEVVDGELRLIAPKSAMRKAKRLMAEQDWGTESAVDQLIFERRAEALREWAECFLPTWEW